MRQLITYIIFSLSILLTVGVSAQNVTVAHEWNETLLQSIRKDFARPTVHSRNLWHTSAAMYDLWALTKDNASPYFLGNTVDGFSFPFKSFPWNEDPTVQLEEAIALRSTEYFLTDFLILQKEDLLKIDLMLR